MVLVIGLGNPGRKYEATRHNAGFLVVDRLAARAGVPCDKAQFGALIAKVRLAGQDVVLAKPQGFMNLSGQPAASLRGYFKLTNADLIVVHDELDVPFGDVRLKVGGGHGGHNGLRDLHSKLGGPDYARVRFGVGRPPEGWDTADYVLSAWTKAEQADLERLVDVAADAVEVAIAKGPALAMNTVNARPKP